MVDYLKGLDRHGHPGWGTTNNPHEEMAKRAYAAVAPAVDRIKNARSAKDPEPEIVIDDTINKDR